MTTNTIWGGGCFFPYPLRSMGLVYLPPNLAQKINHSCKQTYHSHGSYLEDHPRACKWLGSPPCMSAMKRPFWKGSNNPRNSPWSVMGWSFNAPWESKAPTVPSSTGHSLPSANPSTEIFGFTKQRIKRTNVVVAVVVAVVVVVAASATCNHFVMDLSWVNHSSRKGVILKNVLGLDSQIHQILTGAGVFTYICFIFLWNVWVHYTLHWVSLWGVLIRLTYMHP